MNKVYFTWEQYYDLIDQLALKIKPLVQSGEINQILALARGGCIIGDALSRKLNLPLAVMFTSSYSDTQRKELVICEDIAKQYNTFGDKILLVDDLLDSGITLQAVKHYIKNNYNSQVLTAVIWKKTCSSVDADFYVNNVSEDAWIVQPFENIEPIV